MKNFESENISPEEISGKEKKVNKEYKYNSTKFNEQEAEKAKEEIKKLMEKNEELKKKSDDSST